MATIKLVTRYIVQVTLYDAITYQWSPSGEIKDCQLIKLGSNEYISVLTEDGSILWHDLTTGESFTLIWKSSATLQLATQFGVLVLCNNHIYTIRSPHFEPKRIYELSKDELLVTTYEGLLFVSGLNGSINVVTAETGTLLYSLQRKNSDSIKKIKFSNVGEERFMFILSSNNIIEMHKVSCFPDSVTSEYLGIINGIDICNINNIRSFSTYNKEDDLLVLESYDKISIYIGGNKLCIMKLYILDGNIVPKYYVESINTQMGVSFFYQFTKEFHLTPIILINKLLA